MTDGKVRMIKNNVLCIYIYEYAIDPYGIYMGIYRDCFLHGVWGIFLFRRFYEKKYNSDTENGRYCHFLGAGRCSCLGM